MNGSHKQNETVKEQKVPINEASAAIKTHILKLQIEFSEKICNLEDMQPSDYIGLVEERSVDYNICGFPLCSNHIKNRNVEDTLYTSLHPEVKLEEYIHFCCSDCYKSSKEFEKSLDTEPYNFRKKNTKKHFTIKIPKHLRNRFQPEKEKEEEKLKFGVIYVKKQKEESKEPKEPKLQKEEKLKEEKKEKKEEEQPTSHILQSQIKENILNTKVIEKGIEELNINRNDEDAFKVDNYQPNINKQYDVFQPYVPVKISSDLDNFYKLIPIRTRLWDFLSSCKTIYTEKYLQSPELKDFVVPNIEIKFDTVIDVDEVSENDEYNNEEENEEDEDKYLNVPAEDVSTTRMNVLTSKIEPFFDRCIKIYNLPISKVNFALCIQGLLRTFNYYRKIMDMDDNETFLTCLVFTECICKRGCSESQIAEDLLKSCNMSYEDFIELSKILYRSID